MAQRNVQLVNNERVLAERLHGGDGSGIINNICNNNSLSILLVDVHSFPERLRHVERCWAWKVQRRVEVVHPVAVWMLRQENDFSTVVHVVHKSMDRGHGGERGNKNNTYGGLEGDKASNLRRQRGQ